MNGKKVFRSAFLILVLSAWTCHCFASSEGLSFREKLGQMMCFSIKSWNGKPVTKINEGVSSFIKKYGIGNVILFSQNFKSKDEAKELVSELKKLPKDPEKLPMMICTDQEGGIVERFRYGRGRLKNNFEIGSRKWAERASLEKGKTIGKELSEIGINCNLAPVVDVWSNSKNAVIGKRSFGHNSAVVCRCAKNFLRGQRGFGILSVAKHFPGHGDTITDSHFGLPRVYKTLGELEELELLPFKSMIESGVDMIMTAHIEFPNIDPSTFTSRKNYKKIYTPATMSKVILTDVLRKKLGFRGVVLTDSMEMKAISENFGEVEAVKNAILAGANMICMPIKVENNGDLKKLNDFFESLEDLARKDSEFAGKINSSFKLIQKMKEKIK